MSYRFKVEIDERGEVTTVEPPRGKVLNKTGARITAHNPFPTNVQEVIDTHITLLKLQDDPDPCVVIRGRLWCW